MMMTPWRNATWVQAFYFYLLSYEFLSTDHPQLQQVIKDIQSHAVIYLDAIDTSIKTAQDGYAFSSDAIELCDYLLDPTTNIGELWEYIDDMCGKAKSAHGDSVIVLGKFRDVCKGLMEV